MLGLNSLPPDASAATTPATSTTASTHTGSTYQLQLPPVRFDTGSHSLTLRDPRTLLADRPAASLPLDDVLQILRRNCYAADGYIRTANALQAQGDVRGSRRCYVLVRHVVPDSD
eukprot:TRINITY_DN6203_c0_g1_i1.p1 TRINITY_DN6203_c0_g1~~TRINITY_DN6203_c0_g1_i1.p1  ORF type:complete len:115 (-),score=21.72 TRINITY_DN6203_c0_g1_i1:345-689(-)